MEGNARGSEQVSLDRSDDDHINAVLCKCGLYGCDGRAGRRLQAGTYASQLAAPGAACATVSSIISASDAILQGKGSPNGGRIVQVACDVERDVLLDHLHLLLGRHLLLGHNPR